MPYAGLFKFFPKCYHRKETNILQDESWYSSNFGLICASHCFLFRDKNSVPEFHCVPAVCSVEAEGEGLTGPNLSVCKFSQPLYLQHMGYEYLHTHSGGSGTFQRTGLRRPLWVETLTGSLWHGNNSSMQCEAVIPSAHNRPSQSCLWWGSGCGRCQFLSVLDM